MDGRIGDIQKKSLVTPEAVSAVKSALDGVSAIKIDSAGLKFFVFVFVFVFVFLFLLLFIRCCHFRTCSMLNWERGLNLQIL